jgi:ankyrin repeat protein
MELDDEIWDDDAPAMQFYYAAAQGDVKLVQTFLAQGMSANTVGPFGESMLLRAAQFSQVEVARLLLAHSANVNCKDGSGYTALTSAVEEGSIEMVNLLIDAGADMTILGGSDAGTALHTAARDGYVEIVQLLLERGADPNAPDMDGCTVSYLQRTLFLEERPKATSQILVLLKAAGAVD